MFTMKFYTLLVANRVLDKYFLAAPAAVSVLQNQQQQQLHRKPQSDIGSATPTTAACGCALNRGFSAESEFIFCQPRSSVAVCCQLNYAITLGSSVASCRQPRPLWDSHRPLEVYLFAQFSLIVNRIRTPGRTEGPAEGHFVRSPQRVLLTLIKFRPVPWFQICTENKNLE